MLTVFRLLERYPKYRIKVEAHTALHGKIEQNLKLSESAARKVRDFFVEKGVAVDRISYQGFGDTAPLYSAKHIFAGKNRRIDVYLTR
jgi:outer membrane protein OmpA-like peptidoglycan-associated protein